MAAAAVQRPGAPPPPQERYQGVQKESAGYRLLARMGWKEGEGLGASKQGIKSHIKVKKKFENWGVGAVEAAEHAQNWTNGMLDFHRVLSNLSEVVSEHAKRRGSPSPSSSSGSESGSEGGSSSGSDSEASDSEAPAAAAAGGKKGKASGSSSSSSGSEEKAAAAPRRVKAATHIGRFKKREAAKMVKAYSEHDLAAILGADPFAAAAAAVPEVRAQCTASSSGYDSDSEASGEEDEAGSGKKRSKGQKQQKGKAGKKAAAAAAAPSGQQEQQDAQRAEQQAAVQPPAPRQEMIVVRRPMPAVCRPAAAPLAQGPRPDWWQVCFHTAQGEAAVGGQPGAGAGITVHGFSEQDQTNLYNLAHDKATKGRVGLGRSSMPKKVAGARWEGKKTRIENSDDDEDEEAEGEGDWQKQEGVELGPAPAGVQLEKEEGLVIILPASKRHLLDALPDCSAGQVQAAAAQQQQQQHAAAAQQPGKPSKKARKGKKAAAAAAAAEQQQQQQQPPAAEPQAAPAAASGLPAIKWKKAVGAALKASGKGRLKLSKLSKAIAKEQGLAKAQRAAALEGLTAYLQSSSSKFSLEGDVVRPKA
ncbi:D111 G-patch domain-containing family [Chlorella sorokiniana]|uniref:D111 G-patch domain-containing family n=1 Tax=Chlorella sorokiniana TaxID=3076 RepID=A0A2P6U1J0_CHLSO|nr:D111 G-patch domain-containing family [Chlorella sorokiniana]|eukprot:PRW60174.1 D111 G-patch domain-containing family [Chlorella sorokiniana]